MNKEFREKGDKPRVAMKRGYLLRKYGGKIFQSTSSGAASVPSETSGEKSKKSESMECNNDQSNFLMFSELLGNTQHQLIDSLKPVELNSPGKTIEGIRKSLISRFKKNNKCELNNAEKYESHDREERHAPDQNDNPATNNDSFALNYDSEDELPFTCNDSSTETFLYDSIAQQRRPEAILVKPATLTYSDKEVFQIDSPGYKAFIEQHDFTESMPPFFKGF